VKIIQTGEVKVSSIHDIKGSGFGDEQVEDVDVVEFAVGNVNESGDIAVQIKQGMDFYG